MPNLGIVVSDFNGEVTRAMLAEAERYAPSVGLTVTHVVHVPGVFDMPLAVETLARRDDVDGLVAIGAVITGETDHDAVIMHAAARKLTDLAVAHEKPVGLGISGPGQTASQAEARVERGRQAVEAVAAMLRALEGL